MRITIPQPTRAPVARWPAFAFGAAGLASTGAQVLLLRDLLVSAAGDETAIGTGLFAWLAGVAAGGAAARRSAPGRPLRSPVALLAGLALAPGLATLAGRLLRAAFAPPAGELPGAGLVLAGACLTLLPIGFLVGASFTAFASAMSGPALSRESLDRLYIFEAVGSLAGGAAATALVGTALTPLQAGLLSGFLATLIAFPATRYDRLHGRRGLAASALALVLFGVASRPLDLATEGVRFRAGSPETPLVAVADTPVAHLALSGRDVRNLWVNGRYSASFPDPYGSETTGHLAATLAENPRRVLSLPGLALGPLRPLLLHGPDSVTLVEPDPRSLAFVTRWLAAPDLESLSDPRVRVVQGDPRRFLAETGDSFDLLLLLGPDPTTLDRARLTTSGFFRSCASRTAPRGVLVVSLRTAPAALQGETAPLAGALWGALRSAYPVVRATPGPDSLFVAGFDPSAVTLEPGALAARFRARGLTSDSFGPEVIAALLAPDRVAELEQSLSAAAASVPPSSDDRPVSFLHAVSRATRETGSLSGSGLVHLAGLPRVSIALLVLTPSALLAALSFVRRPARRSACLRCAAAGGAAGMLWSVLLLLSFQMREGTLYGALGLLTASFMAGLAAGAKGARAILDRSGAGWRAGLLLALGLGASTGLLVFAWMWLGPHLSGASAPASLAAGALAMGVAGAATGALFPAVVDALRSTGASGVETAGRFETSDHAGAAATALLGSAVLIPALGFAATALLGVALLALAAVELARAS